MTQRGRLIYVDIDLLTMQETVMKIYYAMKMRQKIYHVALNVAKFVKMKDDRQLYEDVTSADLVGIDGMGIVYAARVLGIQAPERVAGIDLMQEVLAICAREGFRPFILGAEPRVLQQAVTNISARHPNLQFAGSHHGYYPSVDEAQVVDMIRRTCPDCLFVALPTPRKERFLSQYRASLDVPFIMGVGGSVDILAGHVTRAPQWMQSSGLEWLYRTIQEPRRMWKRYLTTNVAFAALMLREVFLKRFGGRGRCRPA